jgi:dihydroorotate dehydrogenase electron transfer subunit
MRLYTANVITNSEIRPGVHLVEMQAAALAQASKPGQYCMVRCCDSDATDPLLRRPFFIHTVQRERGLCTLLVQVRGRGTAWLVKQAAGATLDVLGPMGHGWEVRSTVRNLLLVGEGDMLPSLTLLAQTAIEQELAVTLVAQFANAHQVYPPALLPPEVEYHIVTNDGGLGERGSIQDVLKEYLDWADAACCAVSRPIATDLYSRFERLHPKRFAQGLLLQPLVCANGACLTCSVETFSGQRLACKDGPVFDLREIAR